MTEEAWEYHRDSIGGFFQSFGVERRLQDRMNQLGQEGWELIASNRSWLTNRYRLVFKRRVQLRPANRSVA